MTWWASRRVFVRVPLVLMVAYLGLVTGRLVDPAPAHATRGSAPSATWLTSTPNAAADEAEPTLALSWPDRRVQAGVPVSLTVQALGKDGKPDTSRSGTVTLVVDDVLATLSTGSGPDSSLAGTPAGPGQRVAVPLRGGQAVVAIVFATAGPHTVIGTLDGTAELAGEAPTLIVDPTFLAVQGPASTQAGAKQRYTITAQDASGRPVSGYSSPLLISTSDPGALIERIQGTEPGERGAIRLQPDASGSGRLQVDVTFARGGAQRVEVKPVDTPTVPVAQSLTVEAPASPTPRPSPTSSPTPSPSPSTSPSPSPSGSPRPTAAASPTPAASATPVATTTPKPSSTPTATGTPAPTATPTPAPTVTPKPSPSPQAWYQSEPSVGLTLASFQSGTPTFQVTESTNSTNGGVPLTLTVRALDGSGNTYTGYRGTIKLTSTDAAFSPGTAYRYTFTAGDNGQHVFSVTFNTAGAAQTMSVTDTVSATMTGTSGAVAVGETTLFASFGAGTVVQGVSVNMTVQAKDSLGALVTGFRGKVKLTSTYNGVLTSNWGAGVDGTASYTFTAGDAGQHTFTPKFQYAGDQTATVTDTTLPSRTVTTSAITVTNSAPTWYAHESSPAGVKLADGSVLWAFLGVRGRLYARRNVGTETEPAWRSLVTALEPSGGSIGADTPSLVRVGNTVGLFYSFTDGTYYQLWLTTSTDSGDTWSTPVKLTTDAGHVQRIQTVNVGGTVHVFWSRQDTDGHLFYRTSTDLSSFTAKATAGQSIGVSVGKTTSNFGITKLASGSWLLAWLGGSLTGEAPFVQAGDLQYPTVRTATSTDLMTWSSPVEVNQPNSQRWPLSAAVAQNPDDGVIYLLQEEYAYPWDTYIARRTSTNGTSWSSRLIIGSEPSVAQNGSQGYVGRMPAVIPGSIACAASVEVNGGSATPTYGHGSYAGPDTGKGNSPVGCNGPTPPTEPQPMPPTEEPRAPEGSTSPCNQAGGPVNTLTGHQWTRSVDLSVAARGFDLVACRTYNSYDGVAGVDGPFGYGWSWTYGVRAIVQKDGSVTIVDKSGARAHFWKSGSTWTAAAKINATLTAAGGGGYTLTRHNQNVWNFDSTGKLTSIADRNGNTQTLSYSGAVLTGVSAVGGRSLTITSNGAGRITRIDGPGGLYTTYTYDANGNLATATDAAGSLTTYTYDTRHQMLTVVDGNNHTVETNTYGTLGRVVEQRDAANGLWAFDYTYQSYAGSYSSGGNAVTDPRGNVVKYQYDKANQLTQRDAYDGFTLKRRQVWTYTANGDVASYTDPNTRVHSFTYDTRGNLLTATADSGTGGLALQSSYTYNTTNDLLTATDPLSHTTTLTYDSRGNLLTATDALSHTTTYTYDATTGELLTATDATSRTTTFGYNSAGDLTSVTVPGGAQWTSGYDSAGRLTSVTDPLTHSTTIAVDGMGRVTSVTNALSQVTSVLYDAVGNPTRIIDALSRQTNYGFDALNRLTTISDAMATPGVTTYAYDANSNLTSVTNALNRTWTYTFDVLNRPLTATDPLSNQTQFTYDANSNLTHVRKRDLTTNRFVYDRINRLTGVDFANNSTLDVQFAYDNASRRAGMTDATGTTTYSYDNANRLTSLTAPNTGTVAYTYDNANRRTSITYPTSSHQVTYAYDTRGQLSTVADWLSGVTTHTYDSAGRMTVIALPNGVSTTIGYDIADRLTSITHAKGGTNLEAITYLVNAAGNRTQMTDSAGTTTWTYDNLDRLTNASYPNGDTVAYGYDAVGNRTSHTVNGGTPKTNTFNTANQMTTSGPDTYTYDANGNQTIKTVGGTTTTYSYDALDRMTGISGPVTASYVYNGDGLRVRKTVGMTTTNYTWDVLGLPVVVADGNEYVWGAGLISQITGGGTATYAHADGLGSIRALTESTGASVGTQQYDAFGAPRSQSGLQLPFTFTGQQVDSESGLTYLRSRYVDPGTGRFTSEDRFQGHRSLAFSQHKYAYANDSPTVHVDPRGTDTGGACVGARFNFGITISVQACLVVSTNGETGVTITPGIGGSTGVGANVSAGGQWSNADSIGDLAGPFASGGFSAEAGPGIGVDISGAGDVLLVDGAGTLGAAASPFPPMPAEIHGGPTTTVVLPVNPLVFPPLIPAALIGQGLGAIFGRTLSPGGNNSGANPTNTSDRPPGGPTGTPGSPGPTECP